MHTAVLQREAIEHLKPEPNENFIDCAIGQGGHSRLILEKTAPLGRVLGIDADSCQIANCKALMADFGNRLILVNDSYANLKAIAEKNDFKPVHGILLDLGMSTWHLEESGRGFSFLRDEPLDMRYDRKIKNQKSKIKNNLTAERIINEWTREEIEKILREYGEEKFAKRIAKRIAEQRKTKPIKSTFQLVEVIKAAVPRKSGHGRIHFATRTFQALRIAVNDELNNLKKALPQAKDILTPGGRLAVISFHSLEDRIVKNFLKEEKQFLTTLTKKPITSTEEEIKNNPRSRSAKMRAAQKL